MAGKHIISCYYNKVLNGKKRQELCVDLVLDAYYDCDGHTDAADPECGGAPCTCGDVNNSGGLVDLEDFALFANCFGLSGPMPPECEAEHFACSDLDGNGEITLEDFSSFALWFGMTSTSTPPACMP